MAALSPSSVQWLLVPCSPMQLDAHLFSEGPAARVVWKA